MKKRRNRKNIDARIRQLVTLCLRVNRETKHEVDVNLSGISNSISVIIACNGWIVDNKFDFYETCYIKIGNHTFATLNAFRAKLNNLLSKGK